MDISYQTNGDYLIPTLTIDNQKKKSIGKYGRMRKKYLKENKSGLYQSMLLTNTLTNHLIEINEAAQKRLETITEQMKEEQNINETLKETNQITWIQKIGSIQKTAEEIVLTEIIYN